MHESHNAQQYQCPNCLAEQPKDREYIKEYSKGLIDCVACGKRTRVMVYEDYYKALAATRRRIGVDVHWRPS